MSMPAAEAIVYASMSTPFGTGYHFVARGERLAESERDLAAVAEVCTQLGQAGDPKGTFFAGFATRNEKGGDKGWWVWLRGTPQPDWQNRPGVFITGIAVKLSELATFAPGGPWRYSAADLPWVERESIVKKLQTTPAEQLRKCLFWDPLDLAPPPAWPSTQDRVVAEEKQLGNLIRASRRIAENPAEVFQLTAETNPVEKLRWLSVFQSPGQRGSFSAIVNAPNAITWKPRVVIWSEQAQVAASELGRLWPKTKAPNAEADALDACITRLLTSGGASADLFEPGLGATNSEDYWRELVEGVDLARMAKSTRVLHDFPTIRIVALLKQALQKPGSLNLRSLMVEARELPQAFAALWKMLAGTPEIRSLLLDAAGPIDPALVMFWLGQATGVLKADAETCLDLAWSSAQRLKEEGWNSIPLAAVITLPEQHRDRWLGKLMEFRPLLLLEGVEGRGLLSRLSTLPPAVVRPLLEGCIANQDTAMLAWENPALHKALLAADLRRLPMERFRGRERLFADRARALGPGALLELYHSLPTQKDLRYELALALMGSLSQLREPEYDELARGLYDFTENEQHKLARSLDPALTLERVQKLPLAMRHSRAPAPAPAPVAAPSVRAAAPVAGVVKPARKRLGLYVGAGALAVLCVAAAVYWLNSSSVDNLAEREYQQWQQQQSKSKRS